ncbi:MAG: hypothetical protein JW818_13295 [Pirellulales bacterium]|nr:hypothetical protein [Pirellulales bacterium]
MREHTKWIAMVAIGLMLLSMMAYVASDDEAYTPVPSPESQQQTNDQ